MSYLDDARKRLTAIRALAEGRPTTHVYRVTPFGKVCVGCGKRKVDVLPVCDGSKYDESPERLTHFKLSALAILQLDVAELIARLEVADKALEHLSKFRAGVDGGIQDWLNIEAKSTAAQALETIRAQPTK